MHRFAVSYPPSSECLEEGDFFAAHLADKQALETYIRLVEAETEYQEAIDFAKDVHRHESNGNERLACQLLVALILRGVGVWEAEEVLRQLEERKSQAFLYSRISSTLDCSPDACYDCYADPELESNIDLLKKALLEHVLSPALCTSSGAFCLSQ